MEVLEEKNGNDLEAVIAVLEHAKSKTGNGKPVAIILHTEMGQGVDFMMGSHSWHGKAQNDATVRKCTFSTLCRNRSRLLILLNLIHMKFTYTEKKDTRSGFGAGLAELADKNPNVVALCADLIGSLKMEKFIEKAPERFVQTGIAEANMMVLLGF